MLERIQKIISAAGVTSRRAAEQLILDGRVRVNGKVVTELGTKADAVSDHIKIDGKLINPRQPLTYIMLNKPAGFVTTMSDPEGRPTVQDLLKGVKIRVYPVGRLDYNTEGLLLMTNDGDFAHLVTHPRHEFPKTYRTKVKGVLDERQIDELEQGIWLDDGKTAPAKLKKISREEANSWLEITIHEGRKRQVRRMFDRVGHSVIKLKRIKTGGLTLGDLPEGAFRYLTPAEVEALKDLASKETKIETRIPKAEVKQARSEDRPRRLPGRPENISGMPPRRRGTRPDVRPGHSARAAEQRSAAGPVAREGRGAAPAARRPWTDDRRPASNSQGPRVPGRGASGRGPRRPPRQAASGSRQNAVGGLTASREGKSQDFRFKGKSRMSTETKRPVRGSWNRGTEKSFAFKPGDRKNAAAGMREKINDKSAGFATETSRPAGKNRTGRTSPRTSGRQNPRKPTVQGARSRPFRSGR